MASVGVDSMQRYLAPVNPKVYPHLTITLLGIGLFFMAWFFVYEVTSTKYTRNLLKVGSPKAYTPQEMMVALVAAFFMGFGTLFLMLWVGIFV